MTPIDYNETKRYLRGLKVHGVALELDRMRGWVAALGHPERALPTIHLAGTNGKGSVAAMVEAMVRGAGWRVGLYTSPHLIRLAERIQVDRRPISTEALALAVTELAAVVESMSTAERPSYFEFMTALGLRHFGRTGCDLAVVEVGLGGRLDATNVVTPEVTAITSIGLDHVDWLGGTIEKIAEEKAGIIKPGIPVVLGRLPAAAEQVIRTVAAQRGARVVTVTEEFGPDVVHYPHTGLPGAHQRFNAATATLIARELGGRWRMDPAENAAALARVSWPARWQTFPLGDGTLIVDASHNQEGAAVLDAQLADLVAHTGRRPTVVLGVLGADRARPLLAVAARHAEEIYLVRPNQARACSLEELAALIPAEFGGRVHRTSVAELFPVPQRCALGVDGDTVLVVGSIYLAGEVLARFLGDLAGAEPDLQDF